MKRINLLHRSFRIIGLLIVAFCFALFIKDPDVVFGDSSFMGSKIDSPWEATVPALLDQSAGRETGDTVLMSWIQNDISNELLLTLMLVGTYFIAFARIKDEDEFSYQLRMESMSSAHLINGILLLLANWLFYEGIFLYVMVWGLFSFLLIFSIIFSLKVRNYRKALSNEE